MLYTSRPHDTNPAVLSPPVPSRHSWQYCATNTCPVALQSSTIRTRKKTNDGDRSVSAIDSIPELLATVICLYCKYKQEQLYHIYATCLFTTTHVVAQVSGWGTRRSCPKMFSTLSALHSR